MSKKKGTGRPPKLTTDIGHRILVDWIEPKAAGDKLPSVTALMKTYAVSRNTIERALKRLAAKRAIELAPFGQAQVSRRSTDRWKPFRFKQIGISFRTANSWLQDPFCRDFMRRFMRELHLTDIELMIPTRNFQYSTNDSSAHHFVQEHIIAALLLERHKPEHISNILNLGKPAVAVDFDASTVGIHSICFDNHWAGAFLAKRLIKLGHRKTLLICEPPSKNKEVKDEAWSERREGVLEAMAAGGAPAPRECYLDRQKQSDEIFEKLKSIFCQEKANRPTAIFLPDITLLPSLRLALPKGVKIPRDLTVVGYKNANQDNELTGISFDAADLARKAATTLLSMLCDPHWQKRKRKIVRIKGHYSAGKTHGRAPD